MMGWFTDTKTRVAAMVAVVTIGSVGAALLPPATASTGKAAGNRAEVVATSQQAAAAAPGSLSSRVRGTFGNAGTVRGTFEPARFFVKRGNTFAYGVLHATLRNGSGAVIGTASKQVTLPVKNARTQAAAARLASCNVLNLVLGPLDLDLLGLQVHLNRVVLDIVATTGAGKLLGNLLCAVTGLLDGTGLLGQLRLANVLNRILSTLRLA